MLLLVELLAVKKALRLSCGLSGLGRRGHSFGPCRAASLLLRRVMLRRLRLLLRLLLQLLLGKEEWKKEAELPWDKLDMSPIPEESPHPENWESLFNPWDEQG